MDSRAWVELLERIPSAQHDNLMLVTVGGTEISIQGILQMQGESLVLRGRLSGSTDTGRVFFVPYRQIDYMGLIKALPEADVLTLLGLPVPDGVVPAAPPAMETPPPTPSVPPAAEAAPPVAVPPEPPAPTVEPAPAPEPPKPAPQTAMPNKARLLERLRARSHSSGFKPADER